MPATSPGDSSALHAIAFASQYLGVHALEASAPVCASVPPEPDWMFHEAVVRIEGIENMRRIARSPTSFSQLGDVLGDPGKGRVGRSPRAPSRRARCESRSDEEIAASPVTVASSVFFSLPSPSAASGRSSLGIGSGAFRLPSGASLALEEDTCRSSADRLSRSESAEAI